MQTVDSLLVESKNVVGRKRAFWGSYGIVAFHVFQNDSTKRSFEENVYCNSDVANTLLLFQLVNGMTPRQEIFTLLGQGVSDRIVAEYDLLEPGQVLCIHEDNYYNYSQSIVV